MGLVDTHCHIHSCDYPLIAEESLENAHSNGVSKLICVGTTAKDSVLAKNFALENDDVWFSAGHHPHDAKGFSKTDEQIFSDLASSDKLVAVGECGFDYWYLNSPKNDQEKLLRFQLEFAEENNLPVIFHVRGSKDNPHDAFDDLWRVLEDYKNIYGVVHSFSANGQILEEILQKGFCVGINGIMTFTKDENQLSALSAIPLDRIVLETDAPFLTPNPFRGNVNEPKYLVEVAEFVAKFRGLSLDDFAKQTTQTVHQLFNL